MEDEWIWKEDEVVWGWPIELNAVKNDFKGLENEKNALYGVSLRTTLNASGLLHFTFQF